MEPVDGIYEQVVNQLLDKRLDLLDPASTKVDLKELDPGDSHSTLSQYLYLVVRGALEKLEGSSRIEAQIDLCNRIVRLLYPESSAHAATDFTVSEKALQLLAVARGAGLTTSTKDRPDTPLSLNCLLTGTRQDPSLVSQLKKEVLTADQIDILCSFVKWSGIRILENELREFTSRPNSQLRIITTTYMGATDPKALEFLRSLPRTTLRVSFDTHRTRLHAKAYVFHRHTGFGAAYVGSANLSHAALTEGLEWNVKVSQYDSGHLWEKIIATFESYWNDAEFQLYTADQESRLRQAIASERSGLAEDDTAPQFDLRPYVFQQEILEKLKAEREVQSRFRHLIVAATGTGKTMIAAFDYRQWILSSATGIKAPPSLLFIAHREEILKQSLGTFRGVLRDRNFGDLLVGGQRPESLNHTFVSIQSYNSQELWRLPADLFDYVVVDEFHHAAAPSYERLLGHVRPKVLLGLTATPERADGLDILRHFDNHISAEIRLPDAIGRKLLSPFQYFGVTDSVDLSGLRWQKGGYRTDELEVLYVGNEERAALVVQKVREKLLDVRRTCGLGFCASVAHAEFMAQYFRQCGIPAESLSADSDREHRNTIQARLRRLEINFIFVVDLYNEGVDIPEVDTILLLRPTESLTVYLQQLGRGLRLSEGKDCLTVIDFVGQAHRNYRFDMRLRALLDSPSRSIEDEVERGFIHLPAGCTIELERLAKGYILDNIRHAIQQNRTSLAAAIATFRQSLERMPTLGEFLAQYRLSPDDIYRRGTSWSRLCVDAGIRDDFVDPDEKQLTAGLRRIQHVNCPLRISGVLPYLSPQTDLSDIQTLDDKSSRLLLMMHFSLWGRTWIPSSLSESLVRLRANAVMCEELMQLLNFNYEQIDSLGTQPNLPRECPLTLHSLYTRDELLAALGHWTLSSQREMREGVLHMPGISTDLFLVTLNKTAGDCSPTTMYQDYAISESLFHWQSQSTTSAESPTGRRYIEQVSRGNRILLFVRDTKSTSNLANPYYFLGPAEYVSHSGTRPVSIVWRLLHPMPAKLLRQTAARSII